LDLSVIVVNWNTRDLLLSCLESLYRNIGDLAFEVWVVDNASSDGSVAAALARFPDIRVIENPENLGFAAANNRALSRAEGRYAMLLNTDATLTPRAAETLVSFLDANPSAAMACGQLLNTDGSLQNSVAAFPSLLTLAGNETLLGLLFPRRFVGKRRPPKAPVAVDSCIGACLVVRREAANRVGPLDERYFFFMEETDWALQMHRAGWRVFFVPEARIVHAQGSSVGQSAVSRMLFYRSRYLYFKKWHPKTYPLYFAASAARLAVNSVLTLAGVVLTFGLSSGLRRKMGIYGRLIRWHVSGCPHQAPDGGKKTHAG
jgi:GT2 family glycosyltransferase